jgi:hypothetical protein
MNKAGRKNIAAAIRAGLPHLSNGRGAWARGKSEFICYALERGFGMWSSSVKSAQKIIHKRIYPHPTVENWLRAQGAKGITRRKLQAYRKAWMKSLIEEFSK